MYRLIVTTNQVINNEQVEFTIDFKHLEDFKKQSNSIVALDRTNFNYIFEDVYGVTHEFNSSVVFKLEHYEFEYANIFNFLEKKDNGEK